MGGRHEAGSAELNRLQRAVYGPDAGRDVEAAHGRLRELQTLAPDDARPAPNDSPVARDADVGAMSPVTAGPRGFTAVERILWAGVGALVVVVLTIAGFFLGALTSPHPDRMLIPVVEADSGRLANESVTEYREFVADRMKIGIGTLTGEGAEWFRCLYVGGAHADLRSEILSGTCAPTSTYGTTWQLSGDLGTGSSLFGLGLRDSVRFIERDGGLEVWLSREPT